MNASHRAYIPTTAHSNQYILAEFKPDAAFYQAYGDAQQCSDKLSKLFFRLAEDAGLGNIHFIANDKLPVVRYHSEYLCFQTDKQMLFFYNPQYHEAQNSFIKADYTARKIRLLFLATGNDLRSNSADFHKKVSRLLKQFKAELPDLPLQLKVRDHQHLSYDLFHGAKGQKETYAYKLRSLYARYEKRNCTLPEPRQELSYLTVNLPVSRRLKQNLKLHDHNYGSLYETMQASFFKACEAHGLQRCAFVANGKAPIIRNSQADVSESNAELQKISFDPSASERQELHFWDADNLVETVSFIMVAGDNDCVERAYGRFVNRAHHALEAMARDFGLRDSRDDLTVRFYQHISYLM